VGESSFRFFIPSFVRKGQEEVAASHGHGSPNVPMAITMRANPSLSPTSILPLQRRGRAEGLFFLSDNLRDNLTPDDPHKTRESHFFMK
jgi:hypothetical protein